MYQLDITDIPEKLKKDDGTNYLLCIIDQFSEYGLTYIIQNKKAENILSCLKDFIVKNGIPQKINTDNGKEFVNKLLIDYCINNNIIFLKGRPYHPQIQWCVEEFDKEIKSLLENKFLENKDKFAINLILPDILGIYNSNIHSTTKFVPTTLFFTDDNDVIKKAFENTKKSQKKFKKLYSPFKINTKCLLAENFVLKDKR